MLSSRLARLSSGTKKDSQRRVNQHTKVPDALEWLTQHRFRPVYAEIETVQEVKGARALRLGY